MSGSGCGEREGRKGEKSFSKVNATMNTCSVNRVRRRLWGRKRKEKSILFLRGQRDHEHLQCEPCQAAAVRKKIERKRICYFSEVYATMNTCSVNRVRRRLRGDDRKKRREKDYISPRSTRP
jgi:hypothetical protein